MDFFNYFSHHDAWDSNREQPCRVNIKLERIYFVLLKCANISSLFLWPVPHAGEFWEVSYTHSKVLCLSRMKIEGNRNAFVFHGCNICFICWWIYRTFCHDFFLFPKKKKLNFSSKGEFPCLYTWVRLHESLCRLLLLALCWLQWTCGTESCIWSWCHNPYCQCLR